MDVTYSACMETPFSVLGIRTRGEVLDGIEFLPMGTPALAPRDRLAEQAVRELARYIADPEFRFSLPLAPRGTAFQLRVWRALESIPVGESRTYGEIARILRSAPRAVGGACGANPIAVVIPCHRVVGSRGNIGGFMNSKHGDPLAIKRWLLAHEGYRFGA